MGRKKAIRIPIVGGKLKSGTIYSIFALLLILAFVLLAISFNQKAEGLSWARVWMMNQFGAFAFIFPVFFLMGGALSIQPKKVKLVKPRWMAGIILLFISLLGLFGTGEVGIVLQVTVADFISSLGASVLYLTLFLISMLIIFELSLQDFIMLVAKITDAIVKTLQAIFAIVPNKSHSAETSRDRMEDEFVGNKPLAKPMSPSGISPSAQPTKATAAAQTEFADNKFHSAATGISKDWKFPPLSLLDDPSNVQADRGDVKQNSDSIEEALDSFGVRARVVDISYGPAVTQYALQIAKGVKLNKITSLSNNLALALAAPNGQIRIEAPIPGKSLVGIEVPNLRSQTVSLKEMLRTQHFVDRAKLLRVPMGYDVSGNPITVDIDTMPHILVAGTTGSGKSVCLSAWICSILFRTTPDEVKLLLIDPKRVTFSPFDGIPHLMTNIIHDTKDTLSALKWAVGEMEDRYQLLSNMRARDIYSYNARAVRPEERMPMVLIVIDELADLMMAASKEVESLITRIAQKARAVGIYLVLATQRPSVDVITGLMKANIPARVSFNVSSMIDSRVIIDMPGAEKLLGKGDMLYLSPSSSKPTRIQGPFVTEKEINNLVEFFKKTVPVVHYTTEITENSVKETMTPSGMMVLKSENNDPLFMRAVELVCQHRKASTSFLQRYLSVGYGRAARLMDKLESSGAIGPGSGAKPREIRITSPEELNKA
ncbi:DNA translocase FtsK [Candidatus Roizmanbacteria bacterium CG10_big_fil_rev_8_21_14_0_10_45_7]|uniref:DNA translocase FtsK n=1 Tax=Candidatus Roizmanbacteria bacterium CG10_big_fil_rev_8_21_14_0_10_45_7 TaxID=1974854 RepID=A0A2M8KVQ6_9BACT|nr:MAG: DNA translocase FtsK [Candidatus Roizmanbacteria bacterium CG10_big_fil_rev_8_21_14_0_10_45_7]